MKLGDNTTLGDLTDKTLGDLGHPAPDDPVLMITVMGDGTAKIVVANGKTMSAVAIALLLHETAVNLVKHTDIIA